MKVLAIKNRWLGETPPQRSSFQWSSVEAGGGQQDIWTIVLFLLLCTDADPVNQKMYACFLPRL